MKPLNTAHDRHPLVAAHQHASESIPCHLLSLPSLLLFSSIINAFRAVYGLIDTCMTPCCSIDIIDDGCSSTAS